MGVCASAPQDDLEGVQNVKTVDILSKSEDGGRGSRAENDSGANSESEIPYLGRHMQRDHFIEGRLVCREGHWF